MSKELFSRDSSAETSETSRFSMNNVGSVIIYAFAIAMPAAATTPFNINASNHVVNYNKYFIFREYKYGTIFCHIACEVAKTAI